MTHIYDSRASMIYHIISIRIGTFVIMINDKIIFLV